MKDAILSTPAPGVQTSAGLQQPARINTIDILRAITMVLMIFVNDLWSLTNIPGWLLHVDAGVDGMGFSDIIFPAFLFIVGLSIPYAMENRWRKGDSDFDLLRHVVWRSAALLVMGVWLVNGEGINAEATGMSRWVWGPVVCLCFILIWNEYPARTRRAVVYGLRIAAVITMLVLAVVYRGGPDDALRTFGPRWWGILGLIGWAYLASALINVFAKNRLPIIIGAWIFFSALSLLTHAELVPAFLHWIPSAIRGGTLTALTLGGVMTALIFRHFRERNDNFRLALVLAGFAGALFILAALTRPAWGISKLGETPAWLFACSGITILAFLMVYAIADVYRKDHWFRFIRPAGVATLLCYLIPHFAYFVKQIAGVSWPGWMLNGGTGLIKSFLFALLCVGITGLLIRLGVRLRL